MTNVSSYIDNHFEGHLQDLIALCRIPTVSAHGRMIEETAREVESRLRALGFGTEIVPKPEGGHAVLLAERNEGAPRTLLFYNHYDVQPAEPFDLWTTPAFEPDLRDGKLYARGASDNKGNIVARLAALEAILATEGRLPINVKFLIEGDEEIGSPHLGAFVARHRDRLRADACLWEGSGVSWQGQPQVTLGVKGLLYVELTIEVAARDSHSQWATVVPNAAWRLAWALASLKGPDERIHVAGFYDAVRPPTPEEDAALARLPDESAETARSLDMPALLMNVHGPDYSRRHLMEPTCTIDGLSSGYEGEGAKTVLPAKALAKTEFRLVPDQDSAGVATLLRKHLDGHGFSDVRMRVISGVEPARTSPGAPFVRVIEEAGREVYGVDPLIYPTMAGTGPLHAFITELGVDSADCGVGYPDSRIHAPDESIRIDDMRRNIHHLAAIIQRFGAG